MAIQLHCGDCLDIMPQISDQSVDMILADLPYGTTKCKWDNLIDLTHLWKEYTRIIKPGGAILLFGNEPFSSLLRTSNLDWYRYDWYWQKDRAANFLFGNRQPLKNIEIISVFYQSQPTYNPQKTINPKGPSKRHLSKNPAKISSHVKEIMGEGWKATEMDADQNYHGKSYEPDKLLPKQLIYFAKDSRKRLHPTQKPVSLLEYLIRTYTNENETVLDNTAGSGSTGVACQKTGRHGIMIEKSKEYFEIMSNRLKE